MQESIKDKFIEAFTRIAKARKLGDPTTPGINQGPQADKVQYDTVQEFLAIGKEDAGSTIDTGANTTNKDTSTYHIHPVVFTDVPEDSRIMKEEIFGPVVIINTFTTEAEAIAKANDTEYGLYASLYTKDLERALRVAKKLESGMLGVNCTSPTNSWDLPFGGWKSSGTGRESLLDSMDHYLEHKSIYVRVNGIGG